MSLCLSPALKMGLDFVAGSDFSNICPPETANFTECYLNKTFSPDDFIRGTTVFPSTTFKLLSTSELSENWQTGHISLWLGKCITYQSDEEREYSMSGTLYHIMKYIRIAVQTNANASFCSVTDTYLGRGWNIVVFVHNANMLIPSNGMSSAFAGQSMVPLK